MSQPNYRVLVVGLGSMGAGVAQSCVAAGLDTYGLDLDQQRCEALKAAGAVSAGPKINDEAAAQLDAVVMLLVNADQCRAVLFGEGRLAERLAAGAAVMLSSTMAAEDAMSIAAQLEQRGLRVLDAPVSGGAVKAASGDLSIMAAGQAQVFEQLAPVLNAVAAHVHRVGDTIGQGATVKIIHQLLAGVHIAAAAEAMALASRAEVSMEALYRVVTSSAGNSWMFENRMRHVLDGDYTPHSAVNIFVKDLGLVNETGLGLRFPLPLASTAYAMFANAANAGFGEEDDAAVIKTFAGISLPTKGGESSCI
ncbi:L-threonate dehydrogenase [Carnimonas bestiolae]|uniref:L-threonate dehydrogenase n=1 Tax=Carnimonas bestiolae TaxID=3402172 RepID=UPI003EDC12F2